MSAAVVRAALMTKSLARLGTPAGLWLASAAALALSWRPGRSGELELGPPTLTEVAELEAEATDVDAVERDAAIALLRSIASRPIEGPSPLDGAALP